MARLFLALPLPEKLKTRLGEELDRLRLAGAQVGWVTPRNLHVTLRFLGEIDERELLTLDPLFRRCAAAVPPLELVARGLGAFPDLRRPRVLWCGADGVSEGDTAALASLRGRIEEGLKEQGFRREKGEFHPHITVGRVRSPANLERLVERMGPALRREFGHFRVTEAVLFESRLLRTGSEYTELQAFPLGR